jgi:hypothetical protein
MYKYTLSHKNTNKCRTTSELTKARAAGIAGDATAEEVASDGVREQRGRRGHCVGPCRDEHHRRGLCRIEGKKPAIK